MLKELVDYSKRHGLAGPGFAPKMVRWAIHVPSDGIPDIVPLGDASNKKNPGRQFDVCPEASGMNAGGRSHFLVETLETVLLMCKKESDRPKFEAKHAFFVKQLRDAATACPDCEGMLRFAEIVDDENQRAVLIAQLQEHKAKPTDKITVMIAGREPQFLVEDACWHAWWGDYRKTLGKDEGETKEKGPDKAGRGFMRCFVTGEMVVPAMTHPKITELADVGASAMGSTLVSFDKDATCSYGLTQSTNAAMSEEAAAAYRAGLNHILANHSRRLAGAKVAYWFDKQVPEEYDGPTLTLDGFGADTKDESQERSALKKAKELLDAIYHGNKPDFAANNHYYAVTLSGNGGRVVVRDWMTGPFEEMLKNVVAWFEDMDIVHRQGDGLASLPKFMAVLGSLVRDLKDIPAPLSATMWSSAIRNGPIPRTALARAVERACIAVINDNPPNHARMGLIKAYHIRKGDKNTMTVYLNEDHPSKAYQCGRLMAVLDYLQYAAQGDVGAGIIQRYYAAASSTPALTLGQLTRLSQFHLSKLSKEKKGLAVIIERQIADIWGKIKDDLPKTLTLDEQSLFAMGFYQQKAQRSNNNKDEGDTAVAEE